MGQKLRHSKLEALHSNSEDIKFDQPGLNKEQLILCRSTKATSKQLSSSACGMSQCQGASTLEAVLQQPSSNMALPQRKIPCHPAFSGDFTPVPYQESEDVGFISCMQLYNMMNDGQLSPYRFDPSVMLIVDTRLEEDFDRLHVATAYHVDILVNDMGVQPLDSYSAIILYDNKGVCQNTGDSSLNYVMQKLKDKGFSPLLLQGGIEAFREKYPYLCTSEGSLCNRERHSLIGNYPSVVLEDVLYLGNADQAGSEQVIANLGLTHIVNVTKEVISTASETTIKRMTVSVLDDSRADLLTELPRVFSFIQSALDEGGHILVHCVLGVSRSATVLIAYLMYSRQWILQDAHAFLKERRPIIQPNKNFTQQLLRFEVMLFGKTMTDVSRWHAAENV